MSSSALALWALVIASGCAVSDFYPEISSRAEECVSVAGVFFNAGRNDKDPAKVVYPDELKAFLLETLRVRIALGQGEKRDRERSVAIRYFGANDLRVAVLDREGKVLATGKSHRYDTCSRGRLVSVLAGGGDLFTENRYRYTLEIDSAGKLVLSRMEKVAEKWTGLPLSGKSQRTEFDPNPDLDVEDVDFDFERADLEPVGPRPELLAALRTFLDAVDDSPPGAATDPSVLLDVEPLVGASRDEIVGALSAPRHCYHDEGTTSPRPQVPCSSEGTEMVYDFYRLPPGARGGGPELHLAFDESGRCERATWLNTQ